jgi:hypothetical protein
VVVACRDLRLHALCPVTCGGRLQYTADSFQQFFFFVLYTTASAQQTPCVCVCVWIVNVVVGVIGLV